MLPCTSNNKTGLTVLQPILSAFEDKCYDAVEQAFFPGLFHGKCQRNGVEPAGCPNPSCPVICGTPGSIVYHYDSKGVYASFEAVGKLLLEILCASSIGLPSGPHHCERAVMFRFMRSLSAERRNPLVALPDTSSENTNKPGLGKELDLATSFEDHLGLRDDHRHGGPLTGRKAEEDKCKNRQLASEVMPKLREQCGGQNLTGCRWSKEMKQYVLTFP